VPQRETPEVSERASVFWTLRSDDDSRGKYRVRLLRALRGGPALDSVNGDVVSEKPVFGDDSWIARKNALKSLKGGLETMHTRYGSMPGKRCGDCIHFRVDRGHARTYFKCALYGITNGSATDWRVKWQACGKWEQERQS
jgi:hypothetical protein